MAEIKFQPSIGCDGCAYFAGAPTCTRCNYDSTTMRGTKWTHPAAVAPAVRAPAGRKDDSGKLDMTLLDDMPRAVAAIVEVMQWAITKKATPYERGSWLGVHADRYRAAIKRHDRDAAEQASRDASMVPRFERDGETDLLHLAHIACSAMMALENTLRELDKR